MESYEGFLSGYFLGIFVGLILIGVWLLVAYVYWRIGRKFGVGTYGRYCIPFYNLVLACRWIGLSGWSAICWFVPFVDVVFAVYFWGSVAKKLGKNFWLYGITTVLFGWPVLFLAFDNSDPLNADGSLCLYGVSGDYAHSKLKIPPAGLYLGRNPHQANVVLHSREISSVHARVWPDPNGSGLWVQDWNSTNGTYYRRAVNGDLNLRANWIKLRGQVLLTRGEHFRLSDDAAVFEVMAA